LVSKYLANKETGRELVRLLVEVFKRHGEVIRTGWKQLVDLVFILHESRVISSESFAPSTSTAQSNSIEPSPVTPTTPHTPRTPLTPQEADEVVRVSDFLSTECHFEDVFQESRLLSDDAVSALLSAFMSNIGPNTPWSRATKALSVDICVYCALQNRDRLPLLWTVLFGTLNEVALRGQDEMLREHAIVGLGRLALKMAEREEDQEIKGHLLSFLQFLCNLSPDAFDRVAETILAILLKIVELDSMPGRTWRLLSGPDIWPSYFTVMSLVGRKRQCAPYTLGLLMAATSAQSEPLFPLDFFTEYLDLLAAFAGSCQPVDVGAGGGKSKAVALVSPIDMAKTAIQRLCDLDLAMRRRPLEHSVTFFADYSIPVHSVLALQCCHGSREVRQNALSSLHRLVMSVPWATSGNSDDLMAEFDGVLFTLLDELQSDSVVKLNGTVEDTQMGAASMVTKVFLNNMSVLGPEKMPTVLLTLLQKLLGMLRFNSDTLIEGIPETVKNVLFVLKTTCAEEVGEEVWERVWAMVEPVLPDLKRELTVDQAEARKTSSGVRLGGGSSIGERDGERGQPVPSASASAETTDKTATTTSTSISAIDSMDDLAHIAPSSPSIVHYV
jgi:hypothetical protein